MDSRRERWNGNETERRKQTKKLEIPHNRKEKTLEKFIQYWNGNAETEKKKISDVLTWLGKLFWNKNWKDKHAVQMDSRRERWNGNETERCKQTKNIKMPHNRKEKTLEKFLQHWNGNAETEKKKIWDVLTWLGKLFNNKNWKDKHAVQMDSRRESWNVQEPEKYEHMQDKRSTEISHNPKEKH